MEFKGITLHNVRELELNEETGGYKMSRLPSAVVASMHTHAYSASGVELRFVPISDEVKIKIRAVGGASRVLVYYGSVLSGWKNLYKTIYTEPTEITIPKSKVLDKLALLSERGALPFSHEVVRVVLQNVQYEIFDVAGECRPPRPDELPKTKYLAYGSSITHGSLAGLYSNCYAARIAEGMDADNYNLGFAGSAWMEREVADYIAENIEFDFATLEMGVNVFNKIEPEELYERVLYFVERVAKSHPNAKIFCTDIFGLCSDAVGANNPESKINRSRKAVEDAVTKLSLPNVIYTRGLDLMCGARWLSEDLTHPNLRGHEEIARNFIKVIKSNI